jgi:hypothetical protein
MKRSILLFLMVQSICITLLHAQQPVYFGPFVGIQGTKSSYFGFFAAQQATAASHNNSFFGAFSGTATKAAYNSGFGTETLFSNSTGTANTATGFQALYSNTIASFNTAIGHYSLRSNNTGVHNTATGAYALHDNIKGHENTATGSSALRNNTEGRGNTATGYTSLFDNETGEYNTANGHEALHSNLTGFDNTAMGQGSLRSNLSGYWNTATGSAALGSNLTGSQNTATGVSASYSNSRGILNTANGWRALYNNTVGNRNSAFGVSAGPNIIDLENTTALGYQALPTFSNSVRIGNANVTSIGGQVMWSVVSDGRFKRNIKEDVSGLDFVNQLRPVSYEVDKPALNRFLNIPDSVTQQLEAKKAAVRETGFVAQEVEAIVKKTGYVFSGIEAPQNEQDHYSIRYAAFVVPLVKAVQELTAIVNEQQKKSEEQQLEISALKQKLGINEESTSGDMNSTKVALFQNNPNPFSQDTEIKMALPEGTGQASLILYNMEGKELKNFQVNDRGNTSVKISGNDFSAGIYLYALIVDGKVVDTKRLILTK